MKVVEANIYVVETGSFRPIIAELITDEGITGIGEGSVGFGIGCRGAAAMAADLAENFVVGRNPFEIQDIWNDFYYNTFWGKGGGPIFYSACSALEVALWDIKGKALNVPVYELLGGNQRKDIRVYANDWSDSSEFEFPKQFAEKAAEVVADGFDAIKLYPMSPYIPDNVHDANFHVKNRYIDTAYERRTVDAVKEVRSAVGDNIDLMVDVTAEGTTDVMTRIGQSIEKYRPFWYEEPIDAFDIDAYRELKNKVNIPIATGERLYTRYGFRRLIETRGVDIVQPDVGTCGGILEAWRIASMAEASNMRYAPHNCGGPVLCAASIQLACCTSNFEILEVFPYRPDIHYDIVTDPFERKIKNGRLEVPTTPGIGVELNHKVVDRFRVGHITKSSRY
ncbi:MAG: mandelate racemase/muconate lactonizing enzyme family protein [Bacillota bacterium]|nr:mandelate racemase/muconate lactonizing enzyme family protein [Bacillota bacterium]